ncbi:MAG TPA: SRPBCC domain-containing protein [Chitinophagaceae bacterium]
METKTKSSPNPAQPVSNMPEDLVINRVFQLPIAKVWKALTEADEFKKWYGPKGFTCPHSEMEAKQGAKYLNCMRGPDGKDYWSTGTVKEIATEKKLVITDSFSDKDDNIISGTEYGLPGDWPRELLITFELSEADGATKLRLIHHGVPAPMYEECKQGWNESFDKLEENIK